LVRLRGVAVLPQTSTGDLSANAIAAAGNPNVSITDGGIPELDLTYFFTKNITAELILGVTPHTVMALADFRVSAKSEMSGSFRRPLRSNITSIRVRRSSPTWVQA
jgi:outer membrane protein W